jgi:hypothetical protein
MAATGLEKQQSKRTCFTKDKKKEEVPAPWQKKKAFPNLQTKTK